MEPEIVICVYELQETTRIWNYCYLEYNFLIWCYFYREKYFMNFMSVEHDLIIGFEPCKD